MMLPIEDGSPELTLLKEARIENPHAFLGLHQKDGKQVIRIWRPGHDSAKVEVLGKVFEMEKVSPLGLFEHVLDQKISLQGYRIFYPPGLLAPDPYSEAPKLTPDDLDLFKKGIHYDLYSVLGATIHEGGVQFAVWAPRARSVYLKGNFNGWESQMNPMRKVGEIWELFVPGLEEGEVYLFEVHTKEGFLREKSDPMAFFSKLRPNTKSVIFDLDQYEWQDKNWKRKGVNQPVNIYEVHLGSWRKYETEFPNYREIAHDLADYCIKMGFSHLELLPIMEHPLDESWGYQVSGFFSTTSRYEHLETFSISSTTCTRKALE